MRFRRTSSRVNFRHEKGAFTVQTSKPGRFELADGGTLSTRSLKSCNYRSNSCGLFKSKSLRKLRHRTVRVNVRLVAATNQDLGVAISEGRFREDLYYRLNVVHMHLPPLRERASDIPLLVDHFIGRFNQRLGREVHGCSDEARERLKELPWRGNIRELENVVERCMLFCDGDRIELQHIPQNLSEGEIGALRVGELSVWSMPPIPRAMMEPPRLKRLI